MNERTSFSDGSVFFKVCLVGSFIIILLFLVYWSTQLHSTAFTQVDFQQQTREFCADMLSVDVNHVAYTGEACCMVFLPNQHVCFDLDYDMQLHLISKLTQYCELENCTLRPFS